MLVLALLLAAAPPRPSPVLLTIESPRGRVQLPVLVDAQAGPVVPGSRLAAALNGSLKPGLPWTELALAQQSFRFLVGAPLLSLNDRLRPLAGWAVVARDSLFLPLQFVVEVLPAVLGERYAYDPVSSRLIERGPPAPRPPTEHRLPNGLLSGHVVTVDAGHGGRDPGAPGLYFPRGVKEKNVTLAVSLLLRDELKRRGVRVVMTRTADTLISLLDRAGYCTEECDLFVSLHVDALGSSARQHYAEIRGFHTIIIGEQNTEDADRIARLENDALRYEDTAQVSRGDDLDFIFLNLRLNEYLRESARAAELVQFHLAAVHTGDDRGVDQSDRLAVLNTARRPAILVEMGYSTNQRDARLLTNRKSQQALATALADAVVDYLLEYERKVGSGSAPGSGR